MHTVVVGLQWGDEGKGKVADILAEEHDVVVRSHGGANAGHTVVIGSERFALHHIPSGVLRGKICLLTAGMAIHLETLIKELDDLESRGVPTSSIRICERAHVVLPIHREQDAIEERAKGGSAIGTTKRGIGPCYADRFARVGIRIADIFHEKRLRERVEMLFRLKSAYLRSISGGSFEPPDAEDCIRSLRSLGERVRPHICDGLTYLTSLMSRGKSVLFEGAHGSMLDVNYGTYPYVTSSSCLVGNASVSAGVPPGHLHRVVGVAKAYTTRVGAGPFPTEMDGSTADRIRRAGEEFGTTTGRPRRVGWLDLVVLRTAVMMNGVDSIALMKTDVLSALDEVLVCTHYLQGGERVELLPADLTDVEPVYTALPSWSVPEQASDLPLELERYIEFVERETSTRVELVSFGPERIMTIRRSGDRMLGHPAQAPPSS